MPLPPATYAELSLKQKGALEDAFARMSLPLSAYGPNTEAPAEQVENEKMVLTFDQLPHMCRMMNLAMAQHDLEEAATSYGKTYTELTNPSAEAGSGEGPLLFDYDAMITLYNNHAPLQAEYVSQYLAFFNLLDAEEREYVTISDLRHALCNLGDRLTDKEFNHMMYLHGFLHRTTISVYEFTTLVMGISPQECRVE